MANQVLETPYDILGVTIKSSLRDVKKSFIAKALMVHPDKVAGDGDKMMRLKNAFDIVYKEVSAINTDKTYEDFKDEFDLFYFQQSMEVKPDIDVAELVQQFEKYKSKGVPETDDFSKQPTEEYLAMWEHSTEYKTVVDPENFASIHGTKRRVEGFVYDPVVTGNVKHMFAPKTIGIREPGDALILYKPPKEYESSCANDYMEAFTPVVYDIPEGYGDHVIDYDAVVEQRRIMDEQIRRELDDSLPVDVRNHMKK